MRSTVRDHRAFLYCSSRDERRDEAHFANLAGAVQNQAGGETVKVRHEHTHPPVAFGTTVAPLQCRPPFLRRSLGNSHADGPSEGVLGGDYLSPVGGKANVFGIGTGVAMVFLVKDGKPEGRAQIAYVATPEDASKGAKLELISAAKLDALEMTNVEPDAKGNWLDTETNAFAGLLPVADKDVKLGNHDRAVFQLFSLGVVTARDEWVYDADKSALAKKIRFLIGAYNSDVKKLKGNADPQKLDYSIKWTRSAKQNLEKGVRFDFEASRITPSHYRPFNKPLCYFCPHLNEMRYRMPDVFGDHGELENTVIIFTDPGSQKPFMVMASEAIVDYHFVGGAAAAECLPFYRYDAEGERQDNITDWGLKQFRQHYGDAKITKRDLFHYTYAVLHHPAYRAKYEVNLKREFPRLPFYEDFRQWAEWGGTLMDLHLGYEQAAPFPLTRHDRKEPAGKQPDLLPDERVKPKRSLGLDEKPALKPRLKALKDAGEIDATTTLRGIPPEAWDYKLGNRSALEWVLDQWKEHKISDPTVATQFNTYRFADYKEAVIELLHRVCTVSVETMKIVRAMP